MLYRLPYEMLYIFEPRHLLFPIKNVCYLLYMKHPILFYALLMALIATVGALAFGLFALYKGGEFNAKYGNRAMQWRIALQAIAIILFTMMLIFGR
jgi:hypothetical protein